MTHMRGGGRGGTLRARSAHTQTQTHSCARVCAPSPRPTRSGLPHPSPVHVHQRTHHVQRKATAELHTHTHTRPPRPFPAPTPIERRNRRNTARAAHASAPARRQTRSAVDGSSTRCDKGNEESEQHTHTHAHDEKAESGKRGEGRRGDGGREALMETVKRGHRERPDSSGGREGWGVGAIPCESELTAHTRAHTHIRARIQVVFFSLFSARVPPTPPSPISHCARVDACHHHHHPRPAHFPSTAHSCTTRVSSQVCKQATTTPSLHTSSTIPAALSTGLRHGQAQTCTHTRAYTNGTLRDWEGVR